ncbi:sodium:solute symporter [bacterium]|nr:sodium:solute symporter [bacterium]
MITYFTVGSGKFISTFLNIPEAGRIDNALENPEIETLDPLVSDMIMQRMLLDYDCTTSRTDLPQKPAIDQAVRDVVSAWRAVKGEPDVIYNLSKFRAAVRQSGKKLNGLLKSPESAAVPSVVIADLKAFMNSGDALIQEFDRSVSYRALFNSEWVVQYITPEFMAALLMIFLAMLYTVASGLYGVVWTDVFQGVLIFGILVYVCIKAMAVQLPETFAISVPLKDGTFRELVTSREIWTSALPRMKLDFPAESSYAIYNLFGIAIFFYLVKVTIEGCGGTSQYMIQRYYAARSDREAGLLSLFWTFLLSFRWPFIAAIAVMGIVFGTGDGGVISDPEKVLPVVVNTLTGIGIKGFLVAGLMAAAMSTFDSTVNAGAAYWVKDLYQAYINPKASEKNLMLHGRWSSIVIVILGVLFSLTVRNINEIWGWITMSIGAGMIIPTLLRWYWWRMNGYGYAIGIAVGMVAAVVQRLGFPNVPEYVAFSFASILSLVGTVIGTYTTKPTDRSVLDNFYKTTRPFGLWSPVRQQLPASVMEKINLENRRDIISTFFAVPWQVVLFLTMMMIILKVWNTFFILLGLLILLSAGLYFNWFRHLSTEVKVDEAGES